MTLAPSSVAHADFHSVRCERDTGHDHELPLGEIADYVELFVGLLEHLDGNDPRPPVCAECDAPLGSLPAPEKRRPTIASDARER